MKALLTQLEKKNFTPNYTGKFFDQASGLYYFNARWYDCELGRFTTQDPARDGVNWWIYCGGNPITFVDPDGRTNYIFYDKESFRKQAEAEASRIPVTDNEDTVMIPIKTEEEFKNAWNKMENATDVSLFFHGSA